MSEFWSDPSSTSILYSCDSEGSSEIPRMRKLAWAYAGRLCDKHHNLMSWLIYACGSSLASPLSILIGAFPENLVYISLELIKDKNFPALRHHLLLMANDIYVQLKFPKMFKMQTSYYIQLSSCSVAALKCLPVHRYGVVVFTFSGVLGLLGSTLIWKQSSAQPEARRREGCGICHYLSWTDSIKPSLLISDFRCCIFIGTLFRLLKYTDVFKPINYQKSKFYLTLRCEVKQILKYYKCCFVCFDRSLHSLCKKKSRSTNLETYVHDL